jgi:WD40 repeat protein
MIPEVAARLDAICDMFEQSWKSGVRPQIGAFVASQVEHDLQRMVLPHLLAVDAEYRQARDGAAPSLAEYAALLSVDPGELQQMSKDDTWMTGGEQTPIVGDPEVAAGIRQEGNHLKRGDRTKTLEIEGYEILSELGRGGMGIVYKAQQIRAGRLVALKMIHAPHLAGAEQIRRFQAEAAAAARLTHHGIVPVYDVGEHHGLHYFSMEFVDGRTLEMKAREQILACREAAAICKDLAEALEYAHQNGVIHRDVKPHNVLIGADGKPRLTDFGLAKLIDENQDLTGTGQVMGTAAYMAPEQASGLRTAVGPTIDVYSLGATLYRCVTGRPPFQASTTIEVLRQLNEDEPVSPRRLNQEVDAEIETLCLKCLEKEPSRRFQSAGELVAELNRYLNREPIRSRPISVVSRTWRWCLRKPAIAGAVALGLMLLIAIAGGVPYILWRESEFEIAQLQSQRAADALKVSQDAQAIAELKSQQAEERAVSHAARAATQEYYASILRIREQRLMPDPAPGWTWKALESLQKITASSADGKDPVVLRSLIADALTTPDLREIGRIENVPNTGSITLSHDGKLLAAGDWAGIPSQVRIYRINEVSSPSGEIKVEFELTRTCTVDTTADFFTNEVLEKLYPQRTLRREGMWTVDFSPDDKQIAVGSRNGNLILWQIDCDPPRIVFDRRYQEKSPDRIEFSANGRYVYVDYEDPNTVRRLDVKDFRDQILTQNKVRAFLPLNDHEFLIGTDEIVRRVHSSELDRPLSTTAARQVDKLAVGNDSTIALMGSNPPVMFDLRTGRFVTHLQPTASADRPLSLHLIPEASLIVGGTFPENLTAWDALSGSQLFSIAYRGDEIPRLCQRGNAERLFLYSIAEMMAYELRGPTRTSDGGTVPTTLSAADTPVTGVTISSQMIRDFDIRDDLKRLAVIENSAIRFDRNEPIDSWSRARLIDQSDGATIENWTCLTLEEVACTTFTQGNSICLLADGTGIAFTSGTPGNIVVADRQGFRFPGGIGMDVASTVSDSVSPNLVGWPGIAVPETSEIDGVRAGIAVRMPKPFTHPDQRLMLRVIHGRRIQEYSVGADRVDASGWYLFSLGEMPESSANDWRVEAELIDSNMQFQSETAESDSPDKAVVPGQLFLLPWRKMKRGNTPPAYPFRLGPICLRHDGGLAAVVESWTLNQWDADLTTADPQYWRDFENSEQDMHGLVATRAGVVVGTDSGVVAIVREEGGATFLEKARTETGDYDSRDGVTAIAVNDHSHIAAAGNLRGQIRMYDIVAGRGSPIFVTDAHRSRIVALAISENGQRLASADSEGALKFWKRHPDHLELLFEMTANKTPIQSMTFSQDGDLYFLRQEQRGVLRLELDELAIHFRNCGLAMPD